MTRAVIALLAALFAADCVAAARLDLMPDEAFFWMCSRRLAWGYTDHTFMTPLLVRAGSEVFGANPFGARFAFVVASTLIPLAVYLLARPLGSRRDALLAAGLAAIVPGMPRLIALGDVPLLLFAGLALAALERATRTEERSAWLACGASTGLALAAHYRALPMLLGFALYLTWTPRGRAQWRSPGLWLAAALALAGALPWLAWNAAHGFASLRYQLWERHTGGFALAGLTDHLRLQAIALTPPLYLALLGTLAALLRRAARGDDRAALYASFSLAYLGAFLLASTWADREHVSLHWPMPGYLPLLAVLPGELRAFVAARPSTLRKVAVAAVPGVALVATALLHLELATGILGTRERERAFGGWSAGVAAVRDALPALPKQPDGRWLVVVDSYPLAGNLELWLGDAIRVEVLDHPKHAEYGRALQLRLWGLDEASLAARAAETALVALDRNQSRSHAWPAWLAHAGSRFADWREIAEVEADGRRGRGPRFWLYRGVVR